MAARKGEHDIAIGNIIGSNLFNTLAVVGLAGCVKPIVSGAEVLNRDILVMSILTILLFVLGWENGDAVELTEEKECFFFYVILGIRRIW